MPQGYVGLQVRLDELHNKCRDGDGNQDTHYDDADSLYDIVVPRHDVVASRPATIAAACTATLQPRVAVLAMVLPHHLGYSFAG
jgi:hypothetical protein